MYVKYTKKEENDFIKAINSKFSNDKQTMIHEVIKTLFQFDFKSHYKSNVFVEGYSMQFFSPFIFQETKLSNALNLVRFASPKYHIRNIIIGLLI